MLIFYDMSDLSKSMSIFPKKKLARSQNVSLVKLKPMKKINETIYPEWLKSRSDFQKAMLEFEEIDHKDISMIFKKNPRDRSPYEKQALYNWTKSIPFFSKMTALKIKDLVNSFTVETMVKNTYFLRKDLICFLYIVASGEILLKYRLEENVICTKDILTESDLLNSFRFPDKMIVLSDCLLLTLTKSQYDDTLLSQKLGEKYEVSNFLKTIKFFNTWSIGRLTPLISKLFVLHVNKGELIFNFGEASENLYIVQSGLVLEQVNVTLSYTNSWPAKLDLKERLFIKKNYLVELSRHECGSFFGFSDQFSKKVRETQAQALRSTTLYVLPLDFFYDSLSDAERKLLIEYGKLDADKAKLLIQKKDQVKSTMSLKKSILNALEVNLRPASNIFKNPEIDRKMECAKKIVYNKINTTNKELKDVRSHTKIYDKNNRLIKRCCSRDESYMYKSRQIL